MGGKARDAKEEVYVKSLGKPLCNVQCADFGAYDDFLSIDKFIR